MGAARRPKRAGFPEQQLPARLPQFRPTRESRGLRARRGRGLGRSGNARRLPVPHLSADGLCIPTACQLQGHPEVALVPPLGAARSLGSRLILNEGESPGAIARVPVGHSRDLEARAPNGVAFVRPKPVVGLADAWRRPDGSWPPEIGETSSGGSLVQRLRLGKGTLEISVRYFSDVPLHLRAGPIMRTLPPYVADQASFWGVGRITTPGGPLTVRIDVPPRRRPDIARFVQLRSMAATRVDRTGRVVPLKRACGKYVDWFGAGRSTPQRAGATTSRNVQSVIPRRCTARSTRWSHSERTSRARSSRYGS